LKTTFYIDTNAFILIAGLDDSNLLLLSQAILKNEIELFLTHIQIDEHGVEEKSYGEKLENAMKKLRAKNVVFRVEATKGAVWNCSRYGLAEWGSEELNRINNELRTEIEKCNKEKKDASHDALIALSSLDHDFFITNDKCLVYGWRKVIENSQKNRTALEKGHTIPQIFKARTPKSVLKAILERK
jgi:hypothetical protein